MLSAEEKSSKASTDMLPLLRERNRSLTTIRRAVSVLEHWLFHFILLLKLRVYIFVACMYITERSSSTKLKLNESTKKNASLSYIYIYNSKPLDVAQLCS